MAVVDDYGDEEGMEQGAAFSTPTRSPTNEAEGTVLLPRTSEGGDDDDSEAETQRLEAETEMRAQRLEAQTEMRSSILLWSPVATVTPRGSLRAVSRGAALAMEIGISKMRRSMATPKSGRRRYVSGIFPRQEPTSDSDDEPTACYDGGDDKDVVPQTVDRRSSMIALAHYIRKRSSSTEVNREVKGGRRRAFSSLWAHRWRTNRSSVAADEGLDDDISMAPPSGRRRAFSSLWAHRWRVMTTGRREGAGIRRDSGIISVRKPGLLARSFSSRGVRGEPSSLLLEAAEDVMKPKHRNRISSWPASRRNSSAPRLKVVPLQTTNDDEEEGISEHLLLGVSLEFLRDYAAKHGFPKEALTYEVANQIRIDTMGSNRSLAELQQHTCGVGRATIFVSHAQSRPFAKTLDALESYFDLYGLGDELEEEQEEESPSSVSNTFQPKMMVKRSRAYFWFDAFCIRQNQISVDVQKIGALIREIGRTVLVVDPWRKAVCLTRVWCLYEIAHSMATKLQLTMPNSERLAFVDAIRRDERAVVEELSSFDARTARAAFDEDRRSIFELIGASEGGTDGFNRRAHTILKNALTHYKWFAFCDDRDDPRHSQRAITSSCGEASTTR